MARNLRAKVSQDEFDRVLRLVEQKTCFRYTAGTTASSAFMVPVAKDGKTPMGPCIEFTWKQLQYMASLPKRGG